MTKSKRMMFTFDRQSFQYLKNLTKEGDYASMADTVRNSLETTHALQSQARQGFTEIVVRNPVTNQERVMVVPSLQSPPKE
jgi:Arc/MetJ-type ribon-helix-helix transcriptional regulator